MRFRYYNLLWVFLGSVIVIVWALYDFRAAEDELEDKTRARREAPRGKEGEVKNYDEFGKLKTIVTYTSGVKDGLSTLFYPNGQPQLEMPYVKGKRHGISKKYYRNGALYAETPYADDMLTGIRRLYDQTGNLKAEIPYNMSMPGVGTREFNPSGERIPLPEIVLNKKDTCYHVQVDGKASKILFYYGTLENGQYLDTHSATIQMLPTIDSDIFQLDKALIRNQPNGQLILSCRSRQGNPIIRVRNISVE